MSTVRPDMPGLPETVPARMVNEFVYYPRLFYTWNGSKAGSPPATTSKKGCTSTESSMNPPRTCPTPPTTSNGSPDERPARSGGGGLIRGPGNGCDLGASAYACVVRRGRSRDIR